MPVTRFEPNKPLAVRLKYPTGKHVTSKQYGTEQVMYSLLDGSLIYVPLIVEKQLAELNVKRGQRVEICKEQSNGKTEWKVRLQTAPQPAAALADRAPDLDGYPDAPARLQTQLEDALKTALYALKKAEEYSVTIGHPVAFDKDDVRLVAQTLVINARRQAA